MDTNQSGFYLNPTALHPFYYQTREEEGIIDLGLSLKTSQPQVYHHHPYSSGSQLGLEGYGELVDWPPHQASQMLYGGHRKRLDNGEDCVDEEVVEGAESKERWAYVKVNMDGVIVGRKICMLDHPGFASLALQLEEMFGKQSPSGLRLFQPGSEFCLYYKDKEEYWRHVGDVSWKEFVECVKRLRIARKCELPQPFSLPFT